MSGIKNSKFTEEQIAFALRQAEAGIRVIEDCRKLGVSEQTYYRWRKEYDGMRGSTMRSGSRSSSRRTRD
jgi:putative transposase